MIIRKNRAPVDRRTEEDAQTYGPSESVNLSEAGRLTQFVARLETLQPGSRSSDRHWHEEEDELLYMLSGEATVIEEDGPHLLHPGDAACWPAGTANAHQVVNQSGEPCSYLIFGSGAEPDVVHYPERGEILYAFEDGSWQLQRTDGTLVKEGNPD
ncbi:MAG: cupin domain-containing protein [Actinomycetota bacterium]|nr:cupin domain-containing protein [Actinomycetota bacterium]